MPVLGQIQQVPEQLSIGVASLVSAATSVFIFVAVLAMAVAILGAMVPGCGGLVREASGVVHFTIEVFFGLIRLALEAIRELTRIGIQLGPILISVLRAVPPAVWAAVVALWLAVVVLRQLPAWALAAVALLAAAAVAALIVHAVRRRGWSRSRLSGPGGRPSGPGGPAAPPSDPAAPGPGKPAPSASASVDEPAWWKHL